MTTDVAKTSSCTNYSPPTETCIACDVSVDVGSLGEVKQRQRGRLGLAAAS